MYAADKLLAGMSTTGKFTIFVVLIVGVYLIVTVGYMIFCYAFYSHKFSQIRKRLKEYNGDLKTLHRIQELEYDALNDEFGDEEQEESQW